MTRASSSALSCARRKASRCAVGTETRVPVRTAPMAAGNSSLMATGRRSSRCAPLYVMPKPPSPSTRPTVNLP